MRLDIATGGLSSDKICRRHPWHGAVAILTAIVTCLFLCSPAMAITVSTDGLDAVGQSEVRVYRDKLSMPDALAAGNIEMSSNFKFYDNAGMSDEDYENWDSLRGDEANTRFANTTTDESVIAYTGGVSAGINNISGEVKIRFADAALTNEGELCDVIITYNNLTIAAQQAYSYPISVIDGGASKIGSDISLNGFSKSQLQATDSETRHTYREKGWDYRLGFKFDMEFKIVKAGTDEAVNKKMTMKFEDLDTYDSYSRATSNPYYDNYWVDRDGNTLEYVESVVLKEGVIDDTIYVLPDNYLKFDSTDYGENSRISGTKNTGSDEWDHTGFTALVDTSGFKFQVRYNKNIDFYLGFGVPDNMVMIENLDPEPVSNPQTTNPQTSSNNPADYASLFVLLLGAIGAVVFGSRRR